MFLNFILRLHKVSKSLIQEQPRQLHSPSISLISKGLKYITENSMKKKGGMGMKKEGGMGMKISKLNCLANTHPTLTKEWHSTKNILTPYEISYGSHKSVWWKCPVASDHEWKAKVKNRTIGGNGCSCCRGFPVVKSNCLATIQPKISSQWHPSKNHNITPCDVTEKSGKKVWWECEKKHEWRASIAHRSNGTSCPFCANIAINSQNCLSATYKDLMNEWDFLKNKSLDPKKITYGSGKKAWWKCKNGHSWKTCVGIRTKLGTGCPYCNESKGEKKIDNYLKKNRCKYKREYKIDGCKHKFNLSFDFAVFVNGNMFLVEYQGEQHYFPVSFVGKSGNLIKNFELREKRDKIKKDYCKFNNLLLLEIPYYDFENIDTIMDSFIKTELCKC